MTFGLRPPASRVTNGSRAHATIACPTSDSYLACPPARCLRRLVLRSVPGRACLCPLLSSLHAAQVCNLMHPSTVFVVCVSLTATPVRRGCRCEAELFTRRLMCIRAPRSHSCTASSLASPHTTPGYNYPDAVPSNTNNSKLCPSGRLLLFVSYARLFLVSSRLNTVVISSHPRKFVPPVQPALLTSKGRGPAFFLFCPRPRSTGQGPLLFGAMCNRNNPGSCTRFETDLLPQSESSNPPRACLILKSLSLSGWSGRLKLPSSAREVW